MTENFNSPYQYVAQTDDPRRSPDFLKDVFKIPDTFKFSELNGDNDRRSGILPPPNNKIDDMEPISKIDVPPKWTKEVKDASFGEVAKSVSFSPPGGQDTELSLYNRGYPIAPSEGDKFRAVLEKAPHVLNQNEIETLNEQVLGTSVGDRSAFDLKHAETKFINGKKVLAVEGDWKDGGKKFYGCFIPKDDSFRDIQEVFYEGVEPNFSKFRPESDKAISSIQWK